MTQMCLSNYYKTLLIITLAAILYFGSFSGYSAYNSKVSVAIRLFCLQDDKIFTMAAMVAILRSGWSKLRLMHSELTSIAISHISY